MSGTRMPGVDDRQVEGVFVLGMYDSGVELLHAVLNRMGLQSVYDPSDSDLQPLGEFNDRLLQAIGGSREHLPEIPSREAARMLGPLADEARLIFRGSSGGSSGVGSSHPWVWADPRNSFLISFWVQALAVNAAIVFVHRDPEQVLLSRPPDDLNDAEILEQWDRYNRAAMVQCSEWPAMVLSYDELLAKPMSIVPELDEFLKECGLPISADVKDAIQLVESIPIRQRVRSGSRTVGGKYGVISKVLEQIEGRHFGWNRESLESPQGLLNAVSDFYDEDYYGTSYDQSGVPYQRGEKTWEDLFATIADAIVDTFNPRSVLDVGCASGMLVEAFRDRGVDAKGLDISKWAIDQVPDGIRPFCTVGSITEEFDGWYDLITCTEVLEHLPPSLAGESVANLCRHSDAILFSSTPNDFDEPTHLNVEPTGYWAQLFYRSGFVRDVDYDAGFLSPHAVMFRRREVDVQDLIEDYERGLTSVSTNLRSTVEKAAAERIETISLERDQVVAELERVRDVMGDLERRRSAETLAAFDMVRHYEVSERRLAALVDARDAEIEAIHNTKVFKYTASLRKVYGWIRRSRRPEEPPGEPEHPADGTYELWIEEFDIIDDKTRAAIRDRLVQLSSQPTISIIMPVYDPPPDLLRAAIESVRGQLYTNWELCIADDCSVNPNVAEVLTDYEAMDPRIKVTKRDANGHISAASNTALSMATGEWVGCLDHDDILAEHALALSVAAIAGHSDAGIVYSDEDKLDGDGVRHDPYFKPDFDPLLLMGQNYLSHFCLFRRSLVTEVGGYREGYEGSQDWDLTLRVSELLTEEQVVHIPHVLYHWRAHAGSTASGLSAKPYAVDAGRRAVTDHISRLGRAGHITSARIGRSGFNRVCWAPPEPEPLVSIIIPTRDGGPVLQRCIESVLAMTTYVNFEVVVVDNASRALFTLEFLRANDDRLSVIRDERPFNYSAINNAAFRRTSGKIVCLLNDDTEVISEGWLTEMVGHVLQPGVGAVGAKLYYEDGRIQHGGVVLGIHGVAAHSYRLSGRLSPGHSGRLQLAQRMSAVTAACMVIRREAWEAIGGLDEQNLPVAFNDVDFCLRLRERGWGIVWSPYAELFHHESVSRGLDLVGPRSSEFEREVEYMQKRWGPDVLRNDPYYSPNLTLVAGDFSLAWPPRVSYR